MVSSSEVPRNAARTKSEGRAQEGCPKSAAKGIIEAGALGPRPLMVLLL